MAQKIAYSFHFGECVNYRTLNVKQPDVASGVRPETKPLTHYFMVGECVRVLFTSCEESQTNE